VDPKKIIPINTGTTKKRTHEIAKPSFLLSGAGILAGLSDFQDFLLLRSLIGRA
jgi:hypothetical protein